jgi:hypothetical protein
MVPYMSCYGRLLGIPAPNANQSRPAPKGCNKVLTLPGISV